jgi:hypothetical protein
MANVYVEIKVTWYFGKSPTRCSFYDDKKCDAFNFGRFTDSVTSYAIVQAIGNESVTISKLKSDLLQKYRYEMAVPDVKRISRADYIAAIERLREECAA